jgi:hypothetical protein
LISALVLDVVLVIHVLSVLPGLVLGLLAVDEVQPLGLSKLVNLSPGKADKELLGELMADWLSCESVSRSFASAQLAAGVQSVRTLLALVVLEDLEGTEGSGTC